MVNFAYEFNKTLKLGTYWPAWSALPVCIFQLLTSDLQATTKRGTGGKGLPPCRLSGQDLFRKWWNGSAGPWQASRPWNKDQEFGQRRTREDCIYGITPQLHQNPGFAQGGTNKLAHTSWKCRIANARTLMEAKCARQFPKHQALQTTPCIGWRINHDVVFFHLSNGSLSLGRRGPQKGMFTEAPTGPKWAGHRCNQKSKMI